MDGNAITLTLSRECLALDLVCFNGKLFRFPNSLLKKLVRVPYSLSARERKNKSDSFSKNRQYNFIDL